MKWVAGLFAFLICALWFWSAANEKRVRAPSKQMEKGRGEEARASTSPAPRRTVRVHVAYAGSQDPVVGAIVGIEESEVECIATDAQGNAVLAGASVAFGTTLFVRRPGRGPSPERKIALSADAESATVEIPPGRTIRWKIVSGIPAHGSLVTLVPALSHGPAPAHPATGHMDGEWLVVPHWLGLAARARAVSDTGTVAVLTAGWGDSEGRPTKFVPALNIDILLLRRDGSPAEGVSVRASNRGSEPLLARTDADGRARFEALLYSPVTLHVLHGKTPEWLGLIARGESDVSVTHTLRDPARFDLHVIGGDGEAPRVEVIDYPESLVEESVQFDADAGRLRGSIVPPPSLRELTLRVRQGTSKPVDIRMPIASREAVWSADVVVPKFSNEGHLRFEARGEPPALLPILVLENPDDEDFFEQFPAGQLTEKSFDLPAGRYRLRVGGSTLPLGTVDITPGKRSAIIVDWSQLERLECTVLLPSGKPARGGSVRVSGAGMGHYLRRRDDGVHEGWMRADLRYRVQVLHSRYAPHPERGHFEGNGGNQSIRLHLIEGPKLSFRTNAQAGKIDYVSLWDEADDVTPRFILVPRRSGEDWIASGFAPGTYSLWIEPQDAAPYNLPVCELGMRDVDLGEIEFGKGTSLTIQVLVNKPFVAPRLRGTFLLRSEPTVGGIDLDSKTGTTRFDLLPKGRYRIEYYCGPVSGVVDFELDGIHDRVVEIDMRR